MSTCVFLSFLLSCQKMGNQHSSLAYDCQISGEEASFHSSWARFNLLSEPGQYLLGSQLKIQKEDGTQVTPTKGGCVPLNDFPLLVENRAKKVFAAIVETHPEPHVSLASIPLEKVEDISLWDECRVIQPKGKFVSLKGLELPSSQHVEGWFLAKGKTPVKRSLVKKRSCLELPIDPFDLLIVTGLDNQLTLVKDVDSGQLLLTGQPHIGAEESFCQDTSYKFLSQEVFPEMGLCKGKEPLDFLAYCQLPLQEIYEEHWSTIQSTVAMLKGKVTPADEELTCQQSFERLQEKKSLQLEGNISNLSPLRGLEHLIQLRVVGKVMDINLLSQFKELKYLRLEGNPLNTLDPIKELDLVVLVASDSLVDVVPTFVNGTSLKSLNLSGSPIINTQAIGQFKNLQHLVLDGVPLSDLSPLVGLNQIREISLAKTGLKDIEGIESIPLVNVSLNGNEIENIDPLASIETLRLLDVSDNDIDSIDIFSDHPSLNTIYANENKIEQVAGVFQAPKLTKLYLDQNPVRTLHINTDNNMMIEFKCARCQLNNVSDLAFLSRLKWLTLTENPIIFDENHCPTTTMNEVLNEFCKGGN